MLHLKIIDSDEPAGFLCWRRGMLHLFCSLGKSAFTFQWICLVYSLVMCDSAGESPSYAHILTFCTFCSFISYIFPELLSFMYFNHKF